MSWENIIKRGASKKLNFSDLKEITLSNAKPLRGQTLYKDEYFRFIERVSKEYSLRNHQGANMVSRVRNTITKILTSRDLLKIMRHKHFLNYDKESIVDEYKYIFKE
tara:strand:- start:1093 stop:1413 length:321 start_codon:yes stop_codon:yes gene_type:complete